MTISERFLTKVQKTDDCWLWTGGVRPNGYGYLSFRSQPDGTLYQVTAHRLSYIIFNGRVPSGMTLDHTCHSRDLNCPGGRTCLHRRCVNPDHLEPVTQKVNTLRGRGFAAENVKKTHCPQGHPYNRENTYVRPEGRRNCRACACARAARYRAQRRVNAA